jgi:Na+/H+ antiporter NhaA
LNVEPLGRGLAVILKYAGFQASADALEELLDSDLVKTVSLILLVMAAVAASIVAVGTAATLAPVLIALALPLTIALRVVENVSRLLSALNPFD